MSKSEVKKDLGRVLRAVEFGRYFRKNQFEGTGKFWF